MNVSTEVLLAVVTGIGGVFTIVINYLIGRQKTNELNNDQRIRDLNKKVDKLIQDVMKLTRENAELKVENTMLKSELDKLQSKKG
ncbi:hypothetical protein H9L19_06865 [Weissella diestrammenae]|uniref:Uncharacterized protein n=1 Tax=Weissella diestrammenae TaxID=1162633 RepID=A0A7G9T4R4_9LACO|nr:hypothetical protein [Weissella diestrammenae]MCM0582800.1 hypothetical protein [Weissella diestrammenae]QNN75089.1 hypothetical protein H9L19_06865 [Weissella diestrammenae]